MILSNWPKQGIPKVNQAVVEQFGIHAWLWYLACCQNPIKCYWFWVTEASLLIPIQYNEMEIFFSARILLCIQMPADAYKWEVLAGRHNETIAWSLIQSKSKVDHNTTKWILYTVYIQVFSKSAPSYPISKSLIIAVTQQLKHKHIGVLFLINQYLFLILPTSNPCYFNVCIWVGCTFIYLHNFVLFFLLLS